MVIQWYPGHMVKAKRLIKENLALVDVVIELLDARIPMSSRNPDIDEILSNKPRFLILNKADLANESITKQWEDFFAKQDLTTVRVNSITGEGLKMVLKIVKELAKPKMDKLKEKGYIGGRPVRVMIVGIPNVGKSSFINKIVGKTTAKIGNKPGVTKGKQWIRLKDNIELLDTPGVLWPKFEDQEVGLKLAITGAIREEILDTEELAVKLLKILMELNAEALKDRFKLKELVEDPNQLLDVIGAKRGCLVSGGQVDRLKAATIIMEEFQKGKIGRFTLEIPKESP